MADGSASSVAVQPADVAVRPKDIIARRWRPCVRRACACPPTPKCCATWCCCGWLFAIVILVLTVAIGLAVESSAVANAADTAHFYETPVVCGASSAGLLTTRATEAAALAADDDVQHCGDCGGCSSDHDIGVMRATSQNLTRTATRCALRVFLEGREGVENCFDAQVGFSATCTPCWVDNVLCDQQKCLFTCLWGILMGEPNNREAARDELSPCLRCDERMCGPAFVTCAGANRRRAGITSDIGRRDAVELCNITRQERRRTM